MSAVWKLFDVGLDLLGFESPSVAGILFGGATVELLAYLWKRHKRRNIATDDAKVFKCKRCNRQFRNDGTMHRRRVPADLGGTAIYLYYSGLSIREIADSLANTFNIPEPSKATIFEWVRDYSELATLLGPRRDSARLWATIASRNQRGHSLCLAHARCVSESPVFITMRQSSMSFPMWKSSRVDPLARENDMIRSCAHWGVSRSSSHSLALASAWLSLALSCSFQSLMMSSSTIRTPWTIPILPLRTIIEGAAVTWPTPRSKRNRSLGPIGPTPRPKNAIFGRCLLEPV